MSYASVSDFLNRYDSRLVADLVNDTGIRPNLPTLTTAGSGANTVIQAMLDDSAGEINSAILLGNRYTAAEIAALTGPDLAFLVRLNCDLAFIFLAQRRGQDVKELQQWDRTQTILQQLRMGERVFNVAAALNAGTTQASFPSCVAKNTVNFAVTYACRYYPVPRNQQVPNN